MLQIHNSLTGQKEEFKPITPGKVGLYVCGVTVYDYCHIGHARAYVAFDVMYRHLRNKGYKVTYVRNVTDIDDKIIQRAKENNEHWRDLTIRFTQAMYQDFDLLGLLPPDIEPKATEYIPQIINMVKMLIEKDMAYIATNGDIYYQVRKFPGYGELSKRALDQLSAGARVEVNEAKKDPLDFVLWKMAKPEEPSWESPWGLGRPGWHIECSAMSTDCLGEHFDIHGGGQDLLFPHHENERAQSEAATGKKFVNVWVHNGFVNIDEEKMSKSKNNFFTIRQVLAEYDPEVVRYFLMASHYRSPINYTTENLNQARAALSRLYLSLRGLHISSIAPEKNAYITRFEEAMDDDFNSPEALAILFELSKEINRLKDIDSLQADELAATLHYLAGHLGLLQRDPELFLQGVEHDSEMDKKEIERYIALRAQAKERKDWAEADRLRDDLLARGIVAEDSPAGTTWRRI